MTFPAQIHEGRRLQLSDDEKTSEERKYGSLAPDQWILQQLGTAVLLCWPELPIKVQERILEQSGDMCGYTPIVGARKQIIELLMRHQRTI
jgi:hypothetical protein